jgi:hypothetical protein
MVLYVLKLSGQIAYVMGKQNPVVLEGFGIKRGVQSQYTVPAPKGF